MNLLLLSCSKMKVQTSSKIPALQLYDGPTYHVVRNILPTDYKSKLQIIILSAKYGILKDSDLVERYDQRMNAWRAWELKDQAQTMLQQQTAGVSYLSAYINLGAEYLGAIPSYKQIVKTEELVLATGTPGQRLHNLKQWLEKVLNIQRDQTTQMTLL